MKKIFKLATITALLFLAFVTGATAGTAFGIDGTLTGSFFTVGALFANAPQGALTLGIDITQIDPSEIISDLSTYMKFPDNQREFFRKLRNGLELAPYVRSIGNQKGKYIGVSTDSTELLQAFQQGFTPKGTTSFVGYVNEIFRLKLDHSITNIDAIVDSWVNYLSKEGVNRAEWPLTRYIIEMEIIPILTEEMNTAMCRGSYVAPTTGTAGNSIDSMDGLLTIITREIDDLERIVPIATGAITSSNALAKVELFADSIDPLVSDKGGIILCSNTVARYYKTNYRATFGLTNDQAAKNNVMLDNYNIRLVPINGFGTSQRLVFVTQGNLIHLYDQIISPSSFKVEENRRVVDIMADWHCAIGFNSIQGVFANDQA